MVDGARRGPVHHRVPETASNRLTPGSAAALVRAKPDAYVGRAPHDCRTIVGGAPASRPVTSSPDPGAPDAPLTQLLDAAARGDRSAFDRAFALLYDELRALAHAQRRRWQGNETVDTRVLVHEAWLKLVGPGDDGGDENAAGDGPARWTGRRHFFALAAKVMRHVLVNYAEQQHAAKRGGDAERVGLEELEETTPAPVSGAEADDVLALHAALQRLEASDPRQARIVECRFFAGLSIPETAEALGISSATVKREWQAARDRLHAELASATDA